MTIKEIVDIIRNDAGAWAIIVIIITSLIEISPIKINPLGFLLRVIGKSMNKDISERIESLEQKFDEHIEESKNEKIDNVRYEIISSASKLYHNETLTTEHLSRLMSKCDWYEQYCHDNNVANGVANDSIRKIREEYQNAQGTR